MVNQKQLFKQMLDFQKATFDNSFNAMNSLQEQSEKMVQVFLDQAAWMPEEGKNAVKNWVDAYKDGREKFKSAVGEHYKRVDDYFSRTDAE